MFVCEDCGKELYEDEIGDDKDFIICPDCRGDYDDDEYYPDDWDD